MVHKPYQTFTGRNLKEYLFFPSSLFHCTVLPLPGWPVRDHHQLLLLRRSWPEMLRRQMKQPDEFIKASKSSMNTSALGERKRKEMQPSLWTCFFHLPYVICSNSLSSGEFIWSQHLLRFVFAQKQTRITPELLGWQIYQTSCCFSSTVSNGFQDPL